jgi:hypothetical protein
VRPLLPIILITGYAEARLAADLPGDVQLLRKPFRVCELLARVASAVAAADAAGAKRSNILRCGRCKNRGSSSKAPRRRMRPGPGAGTCPYQPVPLSGFLKRGPWRLPRGLRYDPGMLLTALAPAWTLIATIL